MKKPSLPRDPNQRAAQIVKMATGQAPMFSPDAAEDADKNPAAVQLGRLGGLKGGKARAAKLNAAQRKRIASEAAKKRWKKTK